MQSLTALRAWPTPNVCRTAPARWGNARSSTCPAPCNGSRRACYALRLRIHCNACGEGFDVASATLAIDCPKCGARITLTALETKPQIAKAGSVALDRIFDGPPPESLLGTVLGGYRLTAILGGGGMGVVYEAEKVEDAPGAPPVPVPGPKIAAVKVLSSAFARDPDFVERFRREADALTTLRHKNLIEVYAKGDTPPSYYFVMERFFGEDLRSLIARGPVPVETAAAIVKGAAEGLAYAHAHGIVHRDVKPANILVKGDPSKGGEVKVVDFGVAQLAAGQYTLTSLTHSHLVLGTINYMSPEQRIDASKIDHRADVYALGVVAYELLTRRVPIGAFEAPSELLRTLSRAADRAVLSALRRDPEHRPKTALEFARALERALTRRTNVRRWAIAAAAGLVIASLGSFAAYEARDFIRPRKKPPVQKIVEAPPQQAQEREQVQVEEAWTPPPAVVDLVKKMDIARDYAKRASTETDKSPLPITKKRLLKPKVAKEFFEQKLE